VSSGHCLPVRITIHSPGAPALAALLAGTVDVRLTKRTRITLHGQPVTSRETVIGAATVLETDTAREGVAVVHLAVCAGRVGREQSWDVAGLVGTMVRRSVAYTARR
jgi:hypothetical protein